jgi:hypothetical protein
LSKVFKYDLGNTLFVNETAIKGMPNFVGRLGVVREQLTDSIQFDYDIEFDSSTFGKFKESELSGCFNEGDTPISSGGKFTELGTSIGEFTDSKNKQYGSSVDATLEMIKVLMERYRSDENTYTIPESLLQHILLQVRMMDKQNRIFNNPSGKGDSESPYRDLAGYSLIGIDMVEG